MKRRSKRRIGIALVAAAAAAGIGAGGYAASASTVFPGVASTSTQASAPKMLLNTIVPEPGTTVGVAMPISVEFTHPVAPSARAEIERHMKVSSTVPVTGAWHWFGDRRVDWRPKTYWQPGTKVTLDAELAGVADGHGRKGTHAYVHTFTIGADTQVHVSAPGHWMKVTRDGRLVRKMDIDAGSPKFPSWDGTMAVVGKQREVRMTSCSVHITCDKNNPDYYDVTLPWDVRLTTSGTFVHYSTGDPHPGHSYGSHGCVHLSLADAKWFYNYIKQGDPVTISGSPRGKAAADNGYASFDLTWQQWLAGSATGAQTTGAL